MTEPRRVLIYGVTGSGKSTLARRVADRTGLPLVEVDELTWEPGWVPVPDAEQRARMTKVCAEESWVLDHAYGKWLDVPLARVELVVALDLPRLVSLGRLVRRCVVRAARKTPVCNGNVERWRDLVLLRKEDSIIAWHFSSFARKRSRIRQWETDPAFPALVVLRSRRAVESWFATLANG